MTSLSYWLDGGDYRPARITADLAARKLDVLELLYAFLEYFHLRFEHGDNIKMVAVVGVGGGCHLFGAALSNPAVVRGNVNSAAF